MNYLDFLWIDKNFQEISFVKEARSKGKTEEDALHEKLEAALGGNSGEAAEQAKEIEKERQDLIVKNLAESYQVSLSAESANAPSSTVKVEESNSVSGSKGTNEPSKRD